jgi:hypothetical protein
VREIGGESVADVDHCRGDAVLAQVAADGKLGLRIEVSIELRAVELQPGIEGFDDSSRRAERAGYIDKVARSGSGAQDGAALWHRAEDGDVCENSCGRLGDVASGERELVAASEGEETFQKFVGPTLVEVVGQRERQESGERLASYGRDVTQPAGEAAVADGFGGMPFAAEVNAFQTEVGGDNGFVCARDAEHGAIVSDSGDKRGAAELRGAADGGDQLAFSKGH